MLAQISYIDDCDTLGQKMDRKDIHMVTNPRSQPGFWNIINFQQALVLVYQKILEFYKTAFEIITSKGAKLVMKMVLESNRLPNIVQEFLQCADNLRRILEKATYEITQDIKDMVRDGESKLSYT